MSDSSFLPDLHKNKRYKVPCKVCLQETWHSVLTSIDVRDVEATREELIWWENRSFQIVRCEGCYDVSFRWEFTNPDTEQMDPETGEEYRDEKIEVYPARAVGRKVLDDLYMLPRLIYTIYLEIHSAICGNQRVLAGIGIRALIESICKDQSTVGRNLQEKIDDLVTKGVLTQKGAEILHEVRTLGNEAAHEVKPHDAYTLGLAMDVVEHLLMGVYVLKSKYKRSDLPF